MDRAEIAFAQRVAARDLLVRAGRVLNRAGVPVMVLKGIWLQEGVLPADVLRPLSDVDLLVPEHDFERALQAFEAAGFSGTSPDLRQAVLRRAGDPLAVDLHRRLFDRGSFRLATVDLFARAAREIRVDDVHAWAPAPVDGFAHLVGHAAHDRARRRDPVRMGDFALLARYAALDPHVTALHLERCGMARAARYVLREAAREDPFCAAVLAALRPDLLGDRLAAACAWAVPRTALTRPLGGALTYALEESLYRGLGVFAGRAGVALGRARRRGWRNHS